MKSDETRATRAGRSGPANSDRRNHEPSVPEQAGGVSDTVRRSRNPLNRKRLARGWRAELAFGPLVSVWLHIVFLMVAAWLVIRPVGTPDFKAFTSVEYATVQHEELTSLPDIPFQVTEPLADMSPDEVVPSEFNPDLPVSDLTFDDAGDVETLGGSGEEMTPDSMLGAGGVGGTSFFGIESRGRRFIYIVDVSGSMRGTPLDILKDELKASVNALPDYTSFYIMAYNTKTIPMTKEDKWRRASKQNKLYADKWIDSRSADGGTDSTSSFRRAFEFKPQPDVIYFMTDAKDLAGMGEFVSNLNGGVRKTVIHTISFGSDGSEEIMREIARDSGGTFRYVPLRQ
ncbi:MAG: hypothetical protein HND57_17370 [Planctomycetes bacterium]|nr:hypothetical protein [Planctomycetota bacterium]